MKIFTEIDRLQTVLNQYKPLSPEQTKQLRQHLLVEWTYQSNAIEGNTLTRSETKVVLEDGITIGGKTMREHLEAINHKEAILYLEQQVKANAPITESLIKSLHSIILQQIDRQHAGVYRQIKVLISGAQHIPPDAWHVPHAMEELINWHQQSTAMHPVERAARLHSDFVKIHPFVDGNARTVRLLTNLDLMQAGYVPIVIKQDQRAVYYQALDHAHVTGDCSDFIQFVGECLRERLAFYLKFVK